MNTGKGRLIRLAIAAASVAVGATVALAGCASGSPLDSGSGSESASAGGGTLVVGSQAYYSNEIIAEIYAQALEANGFTVQRQFNIGQREAYLPSLEKGEVDVFPEYTGNLLQYYDNTTTASSEDDVYAALKTALPDGLRVLDAADASDQDAYVVSKAFADKYGLKTVEDLAKVDVPLTLGGNIELQTRPYGPEGLQATYGIKVGFAEIEGSGGKTVQQALLDDQIQIADIYTGDPSLDSGDFVVLDDTKHLLLASHVVPLVSSKVDDKAADVLNTVQAALSASDLVALNAESVNDQKAADVIAKDWLAEKKLF